MGTAREKLNAFYVLGIVGLAALIGGVVQSWTVFFAVIAALIAGALCAGDIRPRRGR